MSRNNTDLWLTFVGLLYGLIIAHATFAMVGFGHGWSGAIPTAVALIIAPVLGGAWHYRGHTVVRILALLALTFMGLADILVFVSHNGASIVWKYLPVVLVYWAVMWVTLHVVALALCVIRPSKQSGLDMPPTQKDAPMDRNDEAQSPHREDVRETRPISRTHLTAMIVIAVMALLYALLIS